MISPHINLGQPVNSLDPLNHGLLAWFLCLPGYMRGTNWVDLTKQHTAAYANVTPGNRSGFGAYFTPAGEGRWAGDGTGYLNVGDKFGGLSAMTISFQVRVNAVGANAYPIVSKWGNHAAYDATSSFEVYYSGGNKFTFILAGPNAQAVTPGSFSILSNWHFIGTYDGANIRIYIDGTLVATQAATGVMNASAGTATYFAYAVDPAFSQPFNGFLDDVRIYNRALSDTEAKALTIAARRGYQTQLNQTWEEEWLTKAAVVADWLPIGRGAAPPEEIILEPPPTQRSRTSVAVYGEVLPPYVPPEWTPTGRERAKVEPQYVSVVNLVPVALIPPYLLIGPGAPVIPAPIRPPKQVPHDERAEHKASRDHEQYVARILNSFMRQGIILQIGQQEFTLGFTPGDTSNWPPAYPATIQEALDMLADMLESGGGGGMEPIVLAPLAGSASLTDTINKVNEIVAALGT